MSTTPANSTAPYTTNYTVTGMTCEHCVRAVTDEVTALAGVREVSVDLSSGSLTVTSDTEIALAHLVEAVDEAGYSLAAS